MKKTLLTTLAIIGAVASSFAQGYVTVAGTAQNQTNNTVITSAWTGGLAAGGGVLGATTTGQSYKMALLTSTAGSPTLALFGSGSALTTTWLDTGLLGQNNTFAGRLTIGSALQAANAPVGQSQTWLLVAWSSNLGANWAAVAPLLAAGDFGGTAGFIGWSATGVGAAAAAPPAASFVIQGTGGVIPNAFSLLATPTTPVPEPSTLVLAGLGGLSLLAFRRKK